MRIILVLSIMCIVISSVPSALFLYLAGNMIGAYFEHWGIVHAGLKNDFGSPMIMIDWGSGGRGVVLIPFLILGDFFAFVIGSIVLLIRDRRLVKKEKAR